MTTAVETWEGNSMPRPGVSKSLWINLDRTIENLLGQGLGKT
jgi:hypothetical protein